MRHRTGLILILGGLVLAGLTTALVIRIANQAQEAGRSALRQVGVVMATRDILDQTLISADSLVLRSFPADFAPAGAVGGIEQVVGKFANGFIAREQVVVAKQLLPVQPSLNLSVRVPPGKVAVWLPMPELLTQAGVLKPGDRVDILLTVKFDKIGGEGSQNTGTFNGLSTQTTLQNIEVFRLGEQEVNLGTSGLGSPSGQYSATTQAGVVPAQNAQNGQSGGQGGQSGQAKPPPAKAIGFLVDHQDAVMIKFIKDSGGTIDLVLRSIEEQQIIRTEAVTQDALVDRFRFRFPQPMIEAVAGSR